MTTSTAPSYAIGTLNEDPSIFVAEEGFLYALTPCCNASGKGSDTNGGTDVVCRSCYNEVDYIFGDVLDEAAITRFPTSKELF